MYTYIYIYIYTYIERARERERERERPDISHIEFNRSDSLARRILRILDCGAQGVFPLTPRPLALPLVTHYAQSPS